MKKNRFIIFKKFLYTFVSCAVVFSLVCISAFALEDNTADLMLQADNGTVFYFTRPEFHNTVTGEAYRADVDPVTQGETHMGFRVNLDGYYDVNTRMCSLKVSRSRNSSSYGRFRVTISAGNGVNQTPEQGYYYTLPKLNTTRSNNDAFAVGWFDTTRSDVQYIDYIGELPYEFYIITWFDYHYDTGYVRNLYWNFEWEPSFVFDILDKDSINDYFDTEIEILDEFKVSVDSSTNTINSNLNTDALVKPLQFASNIFTTFYVALDDRQKALIWCSLALGAVAVIFSIGNSIASKFRR